MDNNEIEKDTKHARIAQLKLKLSETDYWETRSYQLDHTSEENEVKFNQRMAWRAELRELEKDLT